MKPDKKKMAQPAKYLPCNYRDLSPVPSTHETIMSLWNLSTGESEETCWPPLLIYSADSRPIRDPDSKRNVNISQDQGLLLSSIYMYTHTPWEPKSWGRRRLQNLWVVISKAREVDWLRLLSYRQYSTRCLFTVTVIQSLEEPIGFNMNPRAVKLGG